MLQHPEGVTVRALLHGGAVRLLLVEARGPAEHTRVVHQLQPDAARLGAEAVVAAALNGAYVKGDEKLTLQLRGQRPECSVYADVTADGRLRVRVTPPDLTLGPRGDVRGILVAVKSLGARQLYQGITEVRDETVEQALSEHLDASSQLDDILRIGVRQAPDGTILQAGGVLVERLPADRDFGSMDRSAFDAEFGWVRDADLTDLLTGLALGRLGEHVLQVLESRPLVWQCRCSPDRIRVALAVLGPQTLQEMLEEDGGAEVQCEFCGRTFNLGADDLRDVLRAQQPPEAE